MTDLGEFGWKCRVCGYAESWSTEHAAMMAAIQHMHDAHVEEWAISPPPLDADFLYYILAGDPKDLGYRFSAEESQL